MKNPISTLTNLAYPGTALAILAISGLSPTTAVLAGALVFLAFGSGWMHGTKDYGLPKDLDHAGIHAVLAALVTSGFGLTWPWVLAATVVSPAVLEFKFNVDLEPAVAVYMLGLLLASLLAGTFPIYFAGFILMGVALSFARIEGDIYHGVWHILTAAGFILLHLATV